MEHRQPPTGPISDWDLARIFLEVARRGSFRAAAEGLGQSINLVRRRIADFERQIGSILLIRDVRGVRLTNEGAEIAAVVEGMETASFGLACAQSASRANSSGEVRVAITEGLGTFWLAPRLVDFQRAHPKMIVDLHCDMRSADIVRNEADIAIQLSRPTALETRIVRLGRLHLMLFASPGYVEQFGKLSNIDELAKHRFVIQSSDKIQSSALYRTLFPNTPEIEVVAMRNNTSSANYLAIAKGVGIGMLPTYVSSIVSNIVPIDIDFRYSFDIWLAYHRASNRVPRIRQMVDWIIAAFDARRYPWFRDEFIPPSRLPKMFENDDFLRLFAGQHTTAEP